MHQIVDPENGNHINLYSDRMNELLKKYKESDLLSFKIPYDRNTELSNDMLYNIMLNLNIKDIISLCHVDKNASKVCDKKLFETILKRDGLYFEGVEKSIESYQLLYQLKSKIDKLWLNNIIFIADIDLLKIFSSDTIKKINKEWEDEQDDPINYHVEELTIYTGYHGDLILNLSFKDYAVVEVNISIEDMKIALLKLFYYYPDIEIIKM